MISEEKAIRMYQELKSSRTNWDTLWEDVLTFVLPKKDDVWRARSAGEEKGERVFDSSPIHFNKLLASALHSMLTNPSLQWFGLATGDPLLDKRLPITGYLQKLVRQIHEILNNTNFQTEIHETYLDLGSIGTNVLFMHEDDETIIRFKSSPIYAHQVKENNKGVIDTLFSERDMTSRQIIQEYGTEALPVDNRHEILKDPEKKFKVIHMILPNEDANPNKKTKGARPYTSLHILEEFKHYLKTDGFHEFPASVPRWSKLTGEKYGRSPGMESIRDIRMLNAMMKVTIRAAQKAVDPPLMVPDESIFGPPNTTPNGVNYYRAGTQDRIFPLDTGARPDIGIDMVNSVREQIKQAFFIDQLQLREGPQMTATEVQARTEQDLRLLGPILGRLHNELLQPMITRIMGIIKRKGLLPEGMPEELKDAPLQVFYTSQIAKAQKIAEAQNLDRVLLQLTPMLQADPSALDVFNTEEVVRFSADSHGLPTEMLNSREEVKEIREQRAQQQQQLIEQEQQQQAAQTEKTQAEAEAV